MSRKAGKNIEWKNALDIKKRVNHLKRELDLDWLKTSQIHFFRSTNSSSRAYARIWGLSRVWQMALNSKPSYIIEVLSEKFDRLPKKDQDKVLLHEITHIPKNFSGSLLPHIKKRGKRNFEDKVKRLILAYSNKKSG